jgi:hypothetical protein
MSDDDTTLSDVLRVGESIVWTGQPDLHTTGLTLQQLGSLAVQIVMAAVVLISMRPFDAPWVTGFFGVVFVGLILMEGVVSPLRARRRLARTTYYLTNRRAIVADGKTVETIGLGSSPFLRYVAGGKRVTATFGPSGPPARFEWAKTQPKGELTFTHVSGVEGLVSALDLLARGSEPKQLRSDWDPYETDGSAGN